MRRLFLLLSQEQLSKGCLGGEEHHLYTHYLFSPPNSEGEGAACPCAIPCAPPEGERDGSKEKWISKNRIERSGSFFALPSWRVWSAICQSSDETSASWSKVPSEQQPTRWLCPARERNYFIATRLCRLSVLSQVFPPNCPAHSRVL